MKVSMVLPDVGCSPHHVWSVSWSWMFSTSCVERQLEVGALDDIVAAVLDMTKSGLSMSIMKPTNFSTTSEKIMFRLFSMLCWVS